MLPFIATVILNFNRWDNTLACLQSLAAGDYPRHHIIVVNVAVEQHIPLEITRDFSQVEVLALAENKGYAGNNNVGIQHALSLGADWVLVLNDDTLLAPDCISRLVEVAESDPRIGMVGPLIYHADEPKVIQSAGGSFDRQWRSHHYGIHEPDHGQFNTTREVAWLNGCSILCRAEALEEIGLLDERFFLYNEEVDWCYRAGKHGWKILLAPQAKLWHKGVSRSYTPSANVTYYMVRNQMLFLQKHHAPLDVKIFTWVERLRMIASYSLRPKWKHARDHRDAAVQGLYDSIFQRWGKRG